MAQPAPARPSVDALAEEATTLRREEELVVVDHAEQTQEHELLSQRLTVVEVLTLLRGAQALPEGVLRVLYGRIASHLCCMPNLIRCPTWPP